MALSASVAATGSPTPAPAVAFSETERVALSPSVNSGGTLEADPTWIPAAVADQEAVPHLVDRPNLQVVPVAVGQTGRGCTRGPPSSRHPPLTSSWRPTCPPRRSEMYRTSYDVTSAPPSSAGADQAMDRLPSPGVTSDGRRRAGYVDCGRRAGDSLADHGPFPASLTARTCTSYRSPLVRLDRVYSRAPELQTSSR